MAYLYSDGREVDEQFDGEKRRKVAYSSNSFRGKRQAAICLQCRAQFPSNNKLHNHIREDCWATKSERKYPGIWTPALKEYVRRAFDPINNVPDWTNTDIQEELETMIYMYHVLDPTIGGGAGWRTMALPQHIDPKDLIYERIPRDRNKNQSVESQAFAPKVYPNKFCASSSTPKSLFAHKDREFFVAHRDSRELLVYMDGACINNGQANSQAGCAFVTHCSDGIPRPWNPPKGAYSMNGMVFFRLEDVGPTGLRKIQTSNRAELRAVLAALQWFRVGHTDLEFWRPKECAKLIIATDSTYVVNGATKWARTWESNGWKLSSGETVKNQDLWEELLKRFRCLQAERCENISIWHIPREQNDTADRGAKYAAQLKARPVFGVPAPNSMPILVDASQLG
ncbi:ribonuclease H-like protein [Hyaloscypha hepaticicola]|uniref:ribonuclease H n=1 Tax=Hyaloscypha hepaticicola TaxID=2082293 RepID=A0A2J6Q8J7_9HELO|nr:ribonuclease H-like protein [Hyaloscypha hepaticicola]